MQEETAHASIEIVVRWLQPVWRVKVLRPPE
jgi:hypothetical protein